MAWNIFGDGPIAWSNASGAGFSVRADSPLAWQQYALCAQTDPETLFPEKGGSTREVEAVCHPCEVREERLEYALANDECLGIWGDPSERERRHPRRSAS